MCGQVSATMPRLSPANCCLPPTPTTTTSFLTRTGTRSIRTKPELWRSPRNLSNSNLNEAKLSHCLPPATRTKVQRKASLTKSQSGGSNSPVNQFRMMVTLGRGAIITRKPGSGTVSTGKTTTLPHMPIGKSNATSKRGSKKGIRQQIQATALRQLVNKRNSPSPINFALLLPLIFVARKKTSIASSRIKNRETDGLGRRECVL